MAQIIISNLPTGIPKGTDETPATDTTDTTEASTGTTKKYFRSSELNFSLTALGLITYAAVVTSSTSALTVTYVNGTLGVGATLTNAGAQVPLVLDGIAVNVNDRVLIQNQAAPAQNGIYTVFNKGTSSANWILVRATDYDQAAQVIQYGVMLVNEGLTNAGLLFQETGAGPFTIGTTAITFAQFVSGTISVPVSLAQGGTGAALTANNGGIFYSNASTGAVLAGTSTALQMLQSGASSAPAWSTAAWPSATVTNQLLYSSTTNTVAGLTTAASATLITSAGGVPSLSQTLPAAVQGNITALGTVATGLWNGTIIGSTYGGTGVNNGPSTITVGGNVAFSGAHTFTATITGNTAVTFPTSGTLATTSANILTAVTQVFITSGTYTPTAGMLYCKVICVGAGGGGGSSVGGTGASAGAGGGSGETRVGYFSAATIGASQTVTIGAGGVAGTGGAAGSTGGTTTLGILTTANGGLGGGTMVNISGNAASIGGAGGTGGSGGDYQIVGNAGYNGFASGSSTSATSGGGASSSLLGGGPIAVATNTVGTSAGTNGAGGSGGASSTTSKNGGAGGGGVIIIEEFIIS